MLTACLQHSLSNSPPASTGPCRVPISRSRSVWRQCVHLNGEISPVEIKLTSHRGGTALRYLPGRFARQVEALIFRRTRRSDVRCLIFAHFFFQFSVSLLWLIIDMFKSLVFTCGGACRALVTPLDLWWWYHQHVTYQCQSVSRLFSPNWQGINAKSGNNTK